MGKQSNKWVLSDRAFNLSDQNDDVSSVQQCTLQDDCHAVVDVRKFFYFHKKLAGIPASPRVEQPVPEAGFEGPKVSIVLLKF